MKLMEKILSQENLEMAIRKVKQNKGAPGIDRMTVQEIEYWFEKYQDELITKIMNKQYRPMPVKRVYIPKPNGKQRPLGIPTVIDRVIQQAIAQVLSTIYEPIFSEHSFGFRPRRSAHMAMEEVLYYLNEGYEWIVDLDIEKFFDTVNHDKLISILREHVNDAATLHLIRAYLRAGVLEDGLIRSTTVGTPQGGPISVVLSNIYLDKFDKELESRGLRFVRYADDCIIFVKSEMSANRVMKSVISWLERKLFLKVSTTKTKVIRPVKGQFLGFTFYKDRQVWKCRPTYKCHFSFFERSFFMLKIHRFNCAGLDVHKNLIVATIGITDKKTRVTEYIQKDFSSLNYDLYNLKNWLIEHKCFDVCMESTGKYWIPVFNILETESKMNIVLVHPKYVKAIKGKKTDKKDSKWICDLFKHDLLKSLMLVYI